MKYLLIIIVAICLAFASSAQDYIGQKESVLKKKTLTKKKAVVSPTTYTMKEGTRTFVYYINKNTGTADGLVVTFKSTTDRNNFLKTLTTSKNKWQFTDRSKTSLRGLPFKETQVTAYVQKNYPQNKAGAVVFNVTQTPIRQKKYSVVK